MLVSFTSLVNKHVDFQYHNDIVIQIQRNNDIDEVEKNTDYEGNVLGENIVLDRLIVMEDVSGLADKQRHFQIF